MFHPLQLLCHHPPTRARAPSADAIGPLADLPADEQPLAAENLKLFASLGLPPEHHAGRSVRVPRELARVCTNPASIALRVRNATAALADCTSCMVDVSTSSGDSNI